MGTACLQAGCWALHSSRAGRVPWKEALVLQWSFPSEEGEKGWEGEVQKGGFEPSNLTEVCRGSQVPNQPAFLPHKDCRRRAGSARNMGRSLLLFSPVPGCVILWNFQFKIHGI